MSDRPDKRPPEERPTATGPLNERPLPGDTPGGRPLDEPRTTVTGTPAGRPPAAPRRTGWGMGGWVIAVIVAIIVIIAASSYWNSGNGGGEGGSPAGSEQPGAGDTTAPATNSPATPAQ